MKKLALQVFSLVCLCGWMLIQVPVSLFHHHEETCSLALDKKSEEKHFHDELEEECFCCAALFTSFGEQSSFEGSIQVVNYKPLAALKASGAIIAYIHNTRERAPPFFA
jgi:hypothetical protein